VIDTKHAPFNSLAPPVWRASTVLFDSLDAFVGRKSRLPDGFTYGTTGTPTQRALEHRIAELDGANHAIVFPSGQAAICMAMLGFVRAGERLLIPESAYPPAKAFALSYLVGLGVDVRLYDPRSIENLISQINEATKLIWIESPGSITMEVQDVPAIVALAKRNGIRTAIDNTWASPLGFRAIEHGVDLCIHACTKYFGGHADVLMGSVSTNDTAAYVRLRQLQAVMGQAVSPEDCALMHRSLETFELRWERQSRSALEVSEALLKNPNVREVRFPALTRSVDHALWQRDFKGSGCVLTLGLVDASLDAYRALFATFLRFAIGASWGGVHSIAAFYPKAEFAERMLSPVNRSLVRLSIGLDPAAALIDELNKALATFAAANVELPLAVQ
jgi:cysteine-S-conjugate beta-lyase